MVDCAFMRAMGMEESEKITAHPLRIISGTALIWNSPKGRGNPAGAKHKPICGLGLGPHGVHRQGHWWESGFKDDNIF